MLPFQLVILNEVKDPRIGCCMFQQWAARNVAIHSKGHATRAIRSDSSRPADRERLILQIDLAA
jgi:hypothetical protein